MGPKGRADLTLILARASAIRASAIRASAIRASAIPSHPELVVGLFLMVTQPGACRQSLRRRAATRHALRLRQWDRCLARSRF